MKKRILILLFPLLMAFHASSDQTFTWMHDLDEARSIAIEQNKPLLVVFRCEP